MADLSLTASQVLKGTGANIKRRLAGEDVDQGEIVYLKSADDRFWLAQSDGTEAEADAVGVVLNSAKAGQPCEVQEFQKGATITLGAGASMTEGVTYYLSNTAGGICPLADLSAGDYVTIVGVATSASVLRLLLDATGAQVQ